MSAEKPKSFIDDLVLEEEGIQALLRRWKLIGMEALLMEFASYRLQQAPTRQNLIKAMEADLRADNEATKARLKKEGKP